MLLVWSKVLVVCRIISFIGVIWVIGVRLHIGILVNLWRVNNFVKEGKLV